MHTPIHTHLHMCTCVQRHTHIDNPTHTCTPYTCMPPHVHNHMCAHTHRHALWPGVSLRNRLCLSLTPLLTPGRTSCPPPPAAPAHMRGLPSPVLPAVGCSAAIWSLRLISVGRWPTWPQLHLEAGLADKLVLEGGKEGEQEEEGSRGKLSNSSLRQAEFQLPEARHGTAKADRAPAGSGQMVLGVGRGPSQWAGTRQSLPELWPPTSGTSRGHPAHPGSLSTCEWH